MKFEFDINYEEIKKLVEQIKQQVTPSQKDRERLKEIENIISERLRRKGLKFILGGSYARDTWLPEDADIDFFVLFDPALGSDGIGKKGLKELEEVVKDLNYWKNYAEHPYIEGMLNGIKFNLVPCADVPPGKWITSMDRSRYHNEYLLKKLNPELRGEVRVFKKFLKSNGLYGAEIKVGGVSGYLSEVLAVKYGSFVEILKNIVAWEQGEVVALEPYDYDPKKVFTTPVIILDPVDQKRNLALAIKNRVLGKLKVLALNFLKSPDVKYFAERQPVPEDRTSNNVVMISFKAPDLVEDIRWGMYYKAEEAVRNAFKNSGYRIIRSTVSEYDTWVTIAVFLEFDKKNFEIRSGPSVYFPENVIKFLKSHSYVWVENDMRLYSFEPGKYVDAKDVLASLKINPINWGVPAGISKNFSEGFVYRYSELEGSSLYFKSAKNAFASLFETLAVDLNK
ncbi:MAG: CCA tRNA nucleotidyltransferase [Nitrososphaeria archaeon]